MGGFSISGSKGSGNTKIIEYDWNQKLSPAALGENLATTRARQLSEKVAGAAQAFSQQRTPANYKKLATAQAELKATTANGGRASANFEPRLTTGAQFDTAAIAPQVLQQTNATLKSATAVLKEFEVGRVQTTGTTGFAGQKAKSADKWSTELSVQQAYVAQVNAAGVIEKRAQGYVVTNVTLKNPKFGNVEGQAASEGFSRPIKNLPIAGAKTLDQALSMARTKINSSEWNGERMIMIAGAGKPIEQMNEFDKVLFALQAGAKTAGPAIQQEIMGMFTPEGMAQLAAFAAASSVPVLGQLMNAGMVAVMLAKLGPEAVKFINGVWNAARATSFTELQTAGDQMSGLIARVVVEGVQLVGMKGAAKVVKIMPKVEVKVGGKVRTIPRPADVINNLTAPGVKKVINGINKKAPRTAEAIAKVGNSPLANETPVVGKTIKAIKKEIKALEVNGGIRPLTSTNPTGAPARTKLTLSGLRDLPQNHAMNRALIALEKLDLTALTKNAKPGESIKVDSGIAGLNIEIAQVATSTGTAIAVKVRAGKSEFSYTPGYDGANKRFNGGDVSAAVIGARAKNAPTNASGKASNAAESTKTDSPNDSTPKGAKAPAKVQLNKQLVYLLEVTKIFAVPGDYVIRTPVPLSAKGILGHTKALATSVKTTDSAAQRRVDANARSQIDWRSAVKESITELDGLLRNSNAPQPAKAKEHVSHLQKKLDLLLKRAERNDWAADAAQVRNAIALTKRPVADFLARKGAPMATVNGMLSGQPPLGRPTPPPTAQNQQPDTPSNPARVPSVPAERVIGYARSLDPEVLAAVSSLVSPRVPVTRDSTNILRGAIDLVSRAKSGEELLQIQAAIRMDVTLAPLNLTENADFRGAIDARRGQVSAAIGEVVIGDGAYNGIKVPKNPNPNANGLPFSDLPKELVTQRNGQTHSFARLPKELIAQLDRNFGVGNWKFELSETQNKAMILSNNDDNSTRQLLATVSRYSVPQGESGNIPADVLQISNGRTPGSARPSKIIASMLIPSDKSPQNQPSTPRRQWWDLPPPTYGRTPLADAIKQAIAVDADVRAAQIAYDAALTAAGITPKRSNPVVIGAPTADNFSIAKTWNFNPGGFIADKLKLSRKNRDIIESESQEDLVLTLNLTDLKKMKLGNDVELTKTRLEIARQKVTMRVASVYDTGWKLTAQLGLLNKTISSLEAAKERLAASNARGEQFSPIEYKLEEAKLDNKISDIKKSKTAIETSIGVVLKELSQKVFSRDEDGVYTFGTDHFPGASKAKAYTKANEEFLPLTPNLNHYTPDRILKKEFEPSELLLREIELMRNDSQLKTFLVRATDSNYSIGVKVGVRSVQTAAEGLLFTAIGLGPLAVARFVASFFTVSSGKGVDKSHEAKMIAELETSNRAADLAYRRLKEKVNSAFSSLQIDFDSKSRSKRFDERQKTAIDAYADAQQLGKSGSAKDITTAALAYAKYLGAIGSLFDSSVDHSAKTFEHWNQTRTPDEITKLLRDYSRDYYPAPNYSQSLWGDGSEVGPAGINVAPAPGDPIFEAEFRER